MSTELHNCLQDLLAQRPIRVCQILFNLGPLFEAKAMPSLLLYCFMQDFNMLHRVDYPYYIQVKLASQANALSSCRI